MNAQAGHLTGAEPLSLAERLTLDAVGPRHWRSRHGEANQNGRSYGGQLLGQAMQAALLEAPPERPASMMQFLFLQGAMPDQPIDFKVRPLQEGKRFTSLHVRGTQGDRTVLDAQVSCALSLPGPEHHTATTAPAGEQATDWPDLSSLPPGLLDRVNRMGGYGLDFNDSIAFRIPEPQRQLAEDGVNGPFRYWMKVPHALAPDARLHTAAFAYLSDWWLNFCALRPHIARAREHAMYISSLNHALWLHRIPRADEWLHVEAISVHAGAGRGLAVGNFHDAQGRHVATATQDCLIAYVD
ncbi:thioesterase family protein [Ramlibacter tataouinensis]|uniref:acyl-CoA thioesterase n=1 Tax=Ramlibacter tataouinensis TaxID=94132 RepID=UPI0022F40447|nr:acyl-CoA thioesterase domain-containing protein [Ramlibacter tataouinensis]WBY03074.1 thioesterase family protein [Ramlibacter tataouinensis]